VWVAWDTSFSSSIIAQLDPEGLLGMVAAFLRSDGALNSTYLDWTGKSTGWYAQSPSALTEIVCDYPRHTGKRESLDAKIGNYSLLGVACFAKTRASSRTRVIRPQRRRSVITPNMTAGHERLREEWIEIPVPALASDLPAQPWRIP